MGHTIKAFGKSEYTYILLDMALFVFPQCDSLEIVSSHGTNYNPLPVATKFFPDGTFEIIPFDIPSDITQCFIYAPSHPNGSLQILWLTSVIQMIRSQVRSQLKYTLTIFVPFNGFTRSSTMLQRLFNTFTLEPWDTLHMLDIHCDIKALSMPFQIINHSIHDLIIELLEDKNPHKDIIVSPDRGSIQRNAPLVKALELPHVTCSKKRDTHNNVTTTVLHEPSLTSIDTAWIIDDVCQTGQTAEACARALRQRGVNYVNMVMTHLQVDVVAKNLVPSVDHIYYVNKIDTWGVQSPLGEKATPLPFRFKLPQKIEPATLPLASSL